MNLLEIIQEVGRSGVEWGKEWETVPGYLTVQIGRDTWREILRLTPHGHAAGTLAGKDIDACARCGLDIRDDIHVRRCRRCGQEMPGDCIPDGCRDPDCPMLGRRG